MPTPSLSDLAAVRAACSSRQADVRLGAYFFLFLAGHGDRDPCRVVLGMILRVLADPRHGDPDPSGVLPGLALRARLGISGDRRFFYPVHIGECTGLSNAGEHDHREQRSKTKNTDHSHAIAL